MSLLNHISHGDSLCCAADASYGHLLCSDAHLTDEIPADSLGPGDWTEVYVVWTCWVARIEIGTFIRAGTVFIKISVKSVNHVVKKNLTPGGARNSTNF